MTQHPLTPLREALETLLNAVVEENGNPTDFPDDDGAVGWTVTKENIQQEMSLTFAMIRRAQQALALLSAYMDPKPSGNVVRAVDEAIVAATQGVYRLNENGNAAVAQAAITEYQRSQAVDIEAGAEAVLKAWKEKVSVKLEEDEIACILATACAEAWGLLHAPAAEPGKDVELLVDAIKDALAEINNERFYRKADLSLCISQAEHRLNFALEAYRSDQPGAEKESA